MLNTQQLLQFLNERTKLYHVKLVYSFFLNILNAVCMVCDIYLVMVLFCLYFCADIVSFIYMYT